MSRINIEHEAQTAIEDGALAEGEHAAYLQAVALDRIATSLERIGLNDSVGEGPGALESIAMTLQEISHRIS